MHKALLQPALRALSHEDLSRVAAEMAIALGAIALIEADPMNRSAEIAESALRNTCVEAIQDLVL